MKIAIILHGDVPVANYGGTQRVAWSLGKALSQMGHRVTLLADHCGPCPFAETININRKRPLTEQVPRDVDIVHLNGLHSGMEYLTQPCIITIHGNADVQKVTPNMVFVSRNHAMRHGSESFVYNGLDWDMYPDVVLSRERRWFHFLGNASWSVKNVRGAINIVTHTPHEHLQVLGGTRLNFRMGFRLTFSSRVHFLGSANDTQKQQAITQSKGLIFPVTWHEPFGLAIIESLYLGCPVFGTPYGSLPELISPDVGVLSNRREELTDAILGYNRFSPLHCHEYARDLFSSQVMAKAYLEKYEKVIQGEPLSFISEKSTDAYKNLAWYS